MMLLPAATYSLHLTAKQQLVTSSMKKLEMVALNVTLSYISIGKMMTVTTKARLRIVEQHKVVHITGIHKRLDERVKRSNTVTGPKRNKNMPDQ